MLWNYYVLYLLCSFVVTFFACFNFWVLFEYIAFCMVLLLLFWLVNFIYISSFESYFKSPIVGTALLWGMLFLLCAYLFAYIHYLPSLIIYHCLLFLSSWLLWSLQQAFILDKRIPSLCPHCSIKKPCFWDYPLQHYSYSTSRSLQYADTMSDWSDSYNNWLLWYISFRVMKTDMHYL